MKAVTLANSAGLEMDLTVYVGQPELLKQTFADFVISRPIPSSTLELQSELNRLKPHFLHFFCHGQSESPQRLEFATIAEQRADAPNGSVLFSRSIDFKSDALSEAWTVVFNCCNGGRPLMR